MRKIREEIVLKKMMRSGFYGVFAFGGEAEARKSGEGRIGIPDRGLVGECSNGRQRGADVATRATSQRKF